MNLPDNQEEAYIMKVGLSGTTNGAKVDPKPPKSPNRNHKASGTRDIDAITQTRIESKGVNPSVSFPSHKSSSPY